MCADDMPFLPLDMLAREVPQYLVHLDDLVCFPSLCKTFFRQTHIVTYLYNLYVKSTRRGYLAVVADMVMAMCQARDFTDYARVRQAWIVLTRVMKYALMRTPWFKAALGKPDLLFCDPPIPRSFSGGRLLLAQRNECLPEAVYAGDYVVSYCTAIYHCRYSRTGDLFMINHVDLVGDRFGDPSAWETFAYPCQGYYLASILNDTRTTGMRDRDGIYRESPAPIEELASKYSLILHEALCPSVYTAAVL